MENHHFIAGKIHYFDWAIFNSYVSLPEGKMEISPAKNWALASENWGVIIKELSLNQLM
jgi:hypothetical protein